MSEIPIQHLPVLQDPQARRAFTMHDRTWHENRYVYPVVSRRSKGISIGVNLNPDKVCNFDCIYCSVDRTIPLPPNTTRDIDLPLLERELSAMLQIATSGEIYKADPFDRIPLELRRINDIAFSGDGEPTTCPQFDEAVRIAARLKDAAQQDNIKLVLITNATMFNRQSVRDTLAFLDQHQGEIWAKLDAGTAEYYDLVDRTPVAFQRVLDNLAWCVQTRPTVIQSLFMRVHGNLPPAAEIQAYSQRLAELEQMAKPAVGGLKLVQLYTVARRTTETYATPLTEHELDQIALTVKSLTPSLNVEIYP